MFGEEIAIIITAIILLLRLFFLPITLKYSICIIVLRNKDKNYANNNWQNFLLSILKKKYIYKK